VNKSGVFVEQLPDGKLEVLGRGLPVRLDVEQAQDVVGGICVLKGWLVLPDRDSRDSEIVRIWPRKEAPPCVHAGALPDAVRRALTAYVGAEGLENPRDEEDVAIRDFLAAHSE
jgi:hypothetical protein